MTTQTVPAIAAGSYALAAAASSVEIAARGAFGGRVHATIDLVDVQVDVAAESSASQARATFDMTSFHSGNAHRDKDIRNRFFRANEHPTMTFTSTELRLGADGRWELLGRLEYRATCEITLVLTSLEADGAGFRARGTATVDRYGCGVTKGRGLIGRWIDVTLSVRLRPA
jgi:polyisoprenoid-binding protein YceI